METRRVDGRDRRFCERCDQVIYRNPKPTAGVVVVDGARVLLVKRAVPPDVDEWGVPAGYLEVDETPEEAAVRELREETSIVVDSDDLGLIDTVSSRHETGKSVVSIGYAVPRDLTTGYPQPGPDVTAVRFWDPSELAGENDERLRSHDTDRVRRAIDRVQSRQRN